MELYTNSNKKSDFLKPALEKNIKENEDIYIATAFFSDIDFIKKAIEKNCNIKLIVRISLATSMQRLKEISEMNNVNIRFFTSNKFHPKLYIFGNSIAFIGSSNLTQSGLKSNQEINISIESENPIFDDLKSLFYEYWEQAEVLDNNYIQKFIKIEEKYYDIDKKVNHYQNDIKEIKECEFDNITIIGKKKQSKEATFISDFKKKYQLFLSNYRKLENIYKSFEKRKEASLPSLPLKIEIDQFLSWIREKEAKGDTFKINKLSNDEIKERVNNLFKSFCNDNYISKEYIKNYNFCIDNLSKSKIDNISEDDLYKCLLFINAFRDREKRYSGGNIDMRKENFFKNNSIDKIKETIKYLLYNTNEEYETRMAKCINDNNLKSFGESSVKELFGIINNNEDIPPCNDRVLKSMQYLGFGDLK
ncbi:hypothetical protein EPJ67_04585 [Brachyspira aalborgi]|uniref:PLD phosphodiesterase domain-containing protein n=1 Tax=Brachyspira aalborgi TaxID=29522 RepID=A0A5C8G699_9SPIR|nr:phospholipase D-like domain-containing protein [Brachyspira aalborgi]TXJ57406.1 hypothetical protein EPJ67_04585 [Brachyspira aalborgi]